MNDGQVSHIGEHLLKAIDLKQFLHIPGGYVHLMDWKTWRIGLLKFGEGMLPQHIGRFIRHTVSEEVFVLLQGKAVIFIGEGGPGEMTGVQAVEMQPNVAYNIKTNAWHHHPVSKDGLVFCVMNSDTDDKNNTYYYTLDENTRAELIDKMCEMWPEYKTEYLHVSKR